MLFLLVMHSRTSLEKTLFLPSHDCPYQSCKSHLFASPSQPTLEHFPTCFILHTWYACWTLFSACAFTVCCRYLRRLLTICLNIVLLIIEVISAVIITVTKVYLYSFFFFFSFNLVFVHSFTHPDFFWTIPKVPCWVFFSVYFFILSSLVSKLCTTRVLEHPWAWGDMLQHWDWYLVITDANDDYLPDHVCIEWYLWFDRFS